MGKKVPTYPAATKPVSDVHSTKKAMGGPVKPGALGFRGAPPRPVAPVRGLGVAAARPPIRRKAGGKVP